MSVMSETFGYIETCRKSHEFLRRGCSYTPLVSKWAGDLIISEEQLLKQSEVNDMRGEAAEVSKVYYPNVGDCPDVKVGIPNQYHVDETDIRSGGVKTFEYAIRKSEDPDEEKNWDLKIAQSLDECGVLMDFGDVLQQPDISRRVQSLCGTINVSSGEFPAQAHYLDNRKSYTTDPDNGLLVAIRTGAVWTWSVLYAPVTKNLSAGLNTADDVSSAFSVALTALGMTHADVFEFGMI